MKRSPFTPEQIIAILQEAERGEKSIGEIARAHGITENLLPLASQVRRPGRS